MLAGTKLKIDFKWYYIPPGPLSENKVKKESAFQKYSEFYRLREKRREKTGQKESVRKGGMFVPETLSEAEIKWLQENQDLAGTRRQFHGKEYNIPTLPDSYQKSSSSSSGNSKKTGKKSESGNKGMGAKGKK